MDQILSAAMAGTQRRSPRLDSPLFEGLTGALPAQLLSAAALAGVAGLAGRSPARAEALAADEQIDERPVAPGQSLQRILNGEFRPVLREWLDLAQRLGLRPEPYHLPQFLEIGLSGASPALRSALGPRGMWLAAHNPRWAPILELVEGDWETGRSAARFRYLAQLRIEDPARALALLQSTWAQESAEDRLRAVTALSKSLSMADEEFLEAALSDRSKGVRQQAASLLSRIPGSRLSQRMSDRVQGWVQFYEDIVNFDIPMTCTSKMERDGIEARSAKGERASWLEQGVALAPLAMWGEPRKIAALAARSEWAEALLRGFLAATVAQGNVPWAGALLSVGIREDSLFAMLPNELQDQLLHRNLGGFPPTWLNLHAHYSVELGSELLNWMRGRTAGDFDKAWAQALLDLSLLLPPQLSAQAERGWPEMTRNWIRWRPSVEKFFSVLHFRQGMHQELAGATPDALH